MRKRPALVFCGDDGRKAGHLALGIGKAAGATPTIIPEEFRRKPIRLKTLVDILVAAFIKRLAASRLFRRCGGPCGRPVEFPR